MKKFLKVVSGLLAALCITAPAEADAQNFENVGKTECGVLYIDKDSVSTVKKDEVFYLAVIGEEKYTDQEFLEDLKEGENMQDAASLLQLYLFNNRGTQYMVAARYVLDSKGQVCADLGSENVLHEIGKDKTMLNAYTVALKAMENKKRFSFKG